MYEDKTFLAIIPARGGSKRLPRKNLLELCGKPLIAWTIISALESKYIDEVIVSSEDEEILDISTKYGAQAFKRPKYLAQDESSTYSVVKDVIAKTKAYDYIILLQPTSPLRESEHIDESIETLVEKNANAIISVCETEHSPLWANVLPSDHNMNRFISKNILNKRSQELPKYYNINGAIYLCVRDELLKKESFFIDENIFAYKMDKYASVDIDERLDFIMATILMEEKGKNVY